MYCIPTAAFLLGAGERKGHTADAVIVSKHCFEEYILQPDRNLSKYYRDIGHIT